MNFDLTEDQRLLVDSVSRLLADRYPFQQRRAVEAAGWSPAVLAELV